MTFGDIHIAIGWIGENGSRLRERAGRIPAHARRAERQEHFSFGAELDDDAALAGVVRIFRALLFAWRSGVGHPDVAQAIDMNAVRPHEHSAAKAADLFSRLIEMVNWIRIGPEASW